MATSLLPFTGKDLPRRNLGAALPWLLTSLILAMVPLAAELPPWVPVGFVACAFFRQVIEARGWRLPALGWRLGLFAAAVGGVMFDRRDLGDPMTLTALLVALISLKLLELHTARDFVLVALLGYFLLLSGFFYEQSLGRTLFASLSILTNILALARCHGAGGGSATGRTTNAGRRPRGGRLWPTTRLTLTLFGQTLPLTLLCFVLFPRLEGQFFRSLTLVNRAKTGMSEDLSPGSVEGLEQSEVIAFRARLPEGELPAKTLYWRAFTLSVCKGLAWSRGNVEGRDNGRGGSSSSSPSAVNNPPAGVVRIAQQITLVEPHGHKWLFALDRPLAVSAVGFLQHSTGDLSSYRQITSSVIYSVESQPSTAGGLSGGSNAAAPGAPPTLPPDLRANYLRLPSRLGNRARELAKSWRAQQTERGEEERTIAQRGLEFFRDGGFVYSLTPGSYAAEPAQALDEFLFSKRRGFCEHFAAAFGTLMRAADLPARVVVGYQGGQWNPFSGHYTVREADAHAWTEVWLENRGWVRFDPTGFVAPERVEYGAPAYAALAALGARSDGGSLETEELLGRLRQPTGWRWASQQGRFMWDSLEQQWNLWVVDYDAPSQQQVFDRLGLNALGQKVFQQLHLGGGAAASAHREWTAALGGGAIFAVIGAALTLGALAWRARKWWLARRAEDPAVRLYRQFCERLTRLVSKKNPARPAAAATADFPPRAANEGPLDFAARASRALPARAAQIAEITARYVAVRYGSANGRTLAELRAAVRRFQ